MSSESNKIIIEQAKEGGFYVKTKIRDKEIFHKLVKYTCSGTWFDSLLSSLPDVVYENIERESLETVSDDDTDEAYEAIKDQLEQSICPPSTLFNHTGGVEGQ